MLLRWGIYLLLIKPIAAQIACILYNGTGYDACCKGLANVYQFGPAVTDTVGTSGDDSIAFIQSWAGTPFKFFGASYTALTVSTNGWLCFSSTTDNSLSSVLFPTYANAVSLRSCLLLDVVVPFLVRIGHFSPSMPGHCDVVDGLDYCSWRRSCSGVWQWCAAILQ
jgi:hypothetical protein